MTNDEKLEIYRAQTVNVSALASAWRSVKRSIHSALLRNDRATAEVSTKLLALCYSAWAEARFSKLIHTPYGFSFDEIRQIQIAARDQDGTSSSWRKCVELALLRVATSQRGQLANIRQSLNRLVSDFVEAPSVLRNKLAHGQLVIALNRENNLVNPTLTTQIDALNVVKLDRLHDALDGLANIIEAIVEAPTLGALRDYWRLAQQVEDRLRETSGFTIEDKVARLRKKKSRALKSSCLASVPNPKEAP